MAQFSGVAMLHEADPKKDLLVKLGDISGFELLHNFILVATYIRPEKTKGGIIITENARSEDESQGKVGLVIKKGPRAFVDDPEPSGNVVHLSTPVKFHGQSVEVGDWVQFHPHSGKQLKINGQHCRLFTSETQISGKVSDPDMVW